MPSEPRGPPAPAALPEDGAADGSQHQNAACSLLSVHAQCNGEARQSCDRGRPEGSWRSSDQRGENTGVLTPCHWPTILSGVGSARTQASSCSSKSLALRLCLRLTLFPTRCPRRVHASLPTQRSVTSQAHALPVFTPVTSVCPVSCAALFVPPRCCPSARSSVTSVRLCEHMSHSAVPCLRSPPSTVLAALRTTTTAGCLAGPQP